MTLRSADALAFAGANTWSADGAVAIATKGVRANAARRTAIGFMFCLLRANQIRVKVNWQVVRKTAPVLGRLDDSFSPRGTNGERVGERGAFVQYRRRM